MASPAKKNDIVKRYFFSEAPVKLLVDIDVSFLALGPLTIRIKQQIINTCYSNIRNILNGNHLLSHNAYSASANIMFFHLSDGTFYTRSTFDSHLIAKSVNDLLGYIARSWANRDEAAGEGFSIFHDFPQLAKINVDYIIYNVHV